MNDNSQTPHQEPTQNFANHNDSSSAEPLQSEQLQQIEQLQAEIEQLKSDIKAAKDAQARANAESYNAQKRIEQEADKSKKYALQKFATDLLEVVDNLERAINTAEPTDNIDASQASSAAESALLEGIRLTHKVLLSTLERQGITVIDPQGEAFNPDWHEAVGIAQDTPSNIVCQVLQKGYLLHGRSIRPAMVTVGA